MGAKFLSYFSLIIFFLPVLLLIDVSTKYSCHGRFPLSCSSVWVGLVMLCHAQGMAQCIQYSLEGSWGCTNYSRIQTQDMTFLGSARYLGHPVVSLERVWHYWVYMGSVRKSLIPRSIFRIGNLVHFPGVSNNKS